MPVYRGPGGAGDATNDATVTAVQAAATSAATSATNAANSATAAATSASGASTSATNASNSATSSAGSATSSANSATTSSNFATNSSLSADDSAASAVEAAGYASDAFDYSVAASVSSGTASDYADSAIAASASAYAHELAAEAVLTDPDFVAVLAIAADIDALSPITADITTVAGIAADVTAVAGNATDISAVADNLVDIGVVAENEADIDTVSGISANVTTVAGISANVTSVAGNATNINAVASNSTNINAVASNATNINAVNANSTNINTVAGIDSDVTTVATNNANVTTVATNIASVNTVAGNTSNINQVASDTVAINSASANASTATTQAGIATTQAAAASASAAAASAVALGNEPVRHSVRPSLLLDFANTKQLDPRITFTRASTGTYYDGKTVAKAEQNLFQQSQTFDDSYWAKTDATITANFEVAPDGTTTAETLTDNATSALHSVGRSTTLNGSSATFSIYAKAGTANFLLVRGSDGTTTRFAWFNLSTGAVETVQTNITASIQSVGNGWYRCIATFASTPTFASTAYFGMSTSDNVSNYSGTGSTIYLWGAQLEQRSSVTAYTATTTAPITNYIPALQTAAAGVARFEHNPTTGESLGLEIEEQRTNLLTYSSEFDNAAWIKDNSSIASNSVVAPDGTLTADSLIEDSTNNVHRCRRAITGGTTNSLSIYAKFNGRRLQIRDDVSTGGFAVFNLLTGVVDSTNNATATITSVGNGWYRCTITISSTSGAFALYLWDAASNTYTGDGFSGVFIWGAQLEAGAFPTSYIPTVASQVTRSADSASMTGTNFSSWYRQDQFTAYVEQFASSGTTDFFYVDWGDSGNRIHTTCTSSNKRVQFLVRLGGANNYVNIGTNDNAYVLNTYQKIATVLSSGNSGVWLNGANIITSSATFPITPQMVILKFSLNTYIKKFALYPIRLTNAELQGVTTV